MRHLSIAILVALFAFAPASLVAEESTHACAKTEKSCCCNKEKADCCKDGKACCKDEKCCTTAADGTHTCSMKKAS